MGYTVLQIANMARTVGDAFLDQLRDASSLGGSDITTALQRITARCNELVQAQAKANQILMDPRYDRAYKLTQVRQLVGDALNTAQAAVQTYSDDLDKAQRIIQSALVPKPPANTDSSILALRAQETIKLLENTAAGGGRITMAGQLLATALANDDQAKAYILAGGVLLTDTYQRLGMDAAALAALFAKIIGQAQGSAIPLPGAKLLAALSGTGGSALSLRGFRDVANIAMYGEVQSFNKSLDAYVALGVVQNGPQNTPVAS